MLDVTVRYENQNFLAEAAEEMIEKYQRVVGHLANELNGRQGQVLPVV